MSKTRISYLEERWEPIVGCAPVSPGCTNCWARELHDRRHRALVAGKRLPLQYAEPFNRVQLLSWRLEQPLHWRTPRRIGVGFGGDLFHPDVPDAFLDRVFAVMALCPQHTFMLLTKRAERMRQYLTARDLAQRWDTAIVAVQPDTDSYPTHDARPWPLPNVWLGVTAEDQPRANERLPHLIRLGEAGWRTWVSLEPLLEAVDISPWLYSGYTEPPQTDRIGWIVIGGESGPNARPCDLAWIRSIVQQGEAAGVRRYVKQVGAWPYQNWPDAAPVPLRVRMSRGRTTQPTPFLGLRHCAGADPSEWPKALRVRDLPEVRA